MADFFKQLIAQLSAIWQKLSIQQKIITSSLLVFTLLGLIGVMVWARSSSVSRQSGYSILYSNLELEDAAAITEKLNEAGYKYKLEGGGKTISVESKKVYEIRMALAREGLPQTKGVGYELFDKTNFGVTEYVQKINSRRALEGELQRTIAGLEEVKSARVHIVIPEHTVFLDQQQPSKATVVLKLKPGRTLNKDQVRGITHLVASSVERLEPQNISVIDYNGKLLSSPFGDEPGAMAASRNIELKQNVEKYLENKASEILEKIVGPGKSEVKISCDMDFDQAEKTLETYNPESRVIRSEERQDENTKNAPDGDHQRERSLTNYEIDKTVERIIKAQGAIKRLTISVAVDGRYVQKEKGKLTYEPRSAEELAQFEDMVKKAVGYNVARGDEISVSNIRFDNEFLREEKDAFAEQEKWARILMLVKLIIAFTIGCLLIWFLRYLAATVAKSMNPPVPQLESLGFKEEIPEEIPVEVKRSSEILEKVEAMSRDEPTSIAKVIQQWLNEGLPTAKKK